ncbi:hypothetical protein KGF57_002580 [Candida theae]|uniref:Uncharacterized protein n=1 Tax=Candida theae TaxID=1198502 RepID=A0AAD5BF11_9ASCO|nr:uncharacterized protein KGF57_002580 [Candida theae]KAI5958225.1 hypothetical protein KGF57_002580 [Candida theae]
MVSMGYEPVEHLPYIYHNISPEERANVEQLIRLELASQFNSNFNTLTAPNALSIANNDGSSETLPRGGPLQQRLAVNGHILPTHHLGEETLPVAGIRNTIFEMDEDDDDEDDDDDFPLSSPLEDLGSSQGEVDIRNGDSYTTSPPVPSQEGCSTLVERSNKRKMAHEEGELRKKRQLNELQVDRSHLEELIETRKSCEARARLEST